MKIFIVTELNEVLCIHIIELNFFFIKVVKNTARIFIKILLRNDFEI